VIGTRRILLVLAILALSTAVPLVAADDGDDDQSQWCRPACIGVIQSTFGGIDPCRPTCVPNND
jgi:hypothetical protein